MPKIDESKQAATGDIEITDAMAKAGLRVLLDAEITDYPSLCDERLIKKIIRAAIHASGRGVRLTNGKGCCSFRHSAERLRRMAHLHVTEPPSD
jgi:hypothetical protein